MHGSTYLHTSENNELGDKTFPYRRDSITYLLMQRSKKKAALKAGQPNV
jgi:hypothetical protein